MRKRFKKIYFIKKKSKKAFFLNQGGFLKIILIFEWNERNEGE